MYQEKWMDEAHYKFDYALKRLHDAASRGVSSSCLSYYWKKVFSCIVKGAKWLKFYAINLSARRVIDRVKRLTEDIIEKISLRGRPETHEIEPDWLSVDEGVTFFPKGTNQCYIIQILDREKNLIYEKCGTTYDDAEKRFKSLLKYYLKDGAAYIKVKKIYNTADKEAEGLESIIRGYYISRHSNLFKSKDRFVGKVFDLRTINRLYNNFMNPIETEFI